MNKELFLTELEVESLSFIISKWIIDRVPFVFKDDYNQFFNWKELLAKGIAIDSNALIFVGSAGCGFSLNPNKNYNDFDSSSDVDVALISQHYFDVAWRALRTTIPGKLTPKQKNSLKDHKERLIYWGIIATDKILPCLPFREEWIKALSEVQKINPTKGRKVNIRIYKDHEAFRAYHMQGLEKLRANSMAQVVPL